MPNVQSTVAVLFPGVNTTDIVNASARHNTQIVIKEQFDAEKDYSRFFKRSRRVITSAQMNLLFIFSDGTSVMAQDRTSLKNALLKVDEENGCFM
jgi:hypothetical protein